MEKTVPIAKSDHDDAKQESEQLDEKKYINKGNADGTDTYDLITEEDNSRVLRKIDICLMPIMTLIYFLQFMDKQTLAFSSVFGIARDTHLVGNQYSILGSIVYIAQLTLQPLSSYLLVTFRLSIFVPFIVTCWGITLASMAAASNFKGLLIARFFLGGLETSITASFILIGQIWYRRQEQGFRLAIWYSNNGWGNVLGSLIMYGLGHIKSHILHSYQLVFLSLGLLTFLVGVFSFFVFPDNPTNSPFLSEEEKTIAIERLRANQQGLETKVFKVAQAVEMITDPKSWCWTILLFLVAVPAGGITSFGPMILQGFGYDSYTVMLLNIPFGALQVISIFTAFWAAHSFRLKSVVLLTVLVPCIVGSGMLYKLDRSPQNHGALLIAYYILAAYSANMPIIMNWQSSNVAGHTKKATGSTTAFMMMGSISGNIVGPLLFSPGEGPEFRKGLTTLLACFSTATVVVCMTVTYLSYLNKRNERRRVVAGKQAKLVDYSMLTAEEARLARAKERTSGSGLQIIGEKAFDDLTDLQNDEFIVGHSHTFYIS
ncbi:allantoate permease [Collybia nuda]|uniref:Allantoate permease n=1 Tax=Collybia nuda TaxID=64659 RepID=A0A9P5Y121_9AGAR|nr:allantoate permease [Collybia nuda]